jgi:hypothetical protein
MKYSPHFFLAAVVATSFSASTALAGGQTSLGPHSAQNFTLVRHVGGIREAAGSDVNSPQTLAIVLTVEQKMVGKEVEITARVGAHKDGPTGPLVGVDNLSVHVSQPADFGTKPAKTGEVHIVKTVPSAGGKYKTVVAEARLNSPQYSDALVTLTIPGEK